MKKTLIALAVLVAAGSVNAAEIYNKDGISFALSGDVDVNYKKDRGTVDAGKTADAGLNLDDADFSFELGSAINEDVKAIGFFEFSGEGGAADTGDIYVGFDSASMGKIVFGKTATILDDSGIGSDYEFGLQGAVENVDFSGSEVIKYKYDNGEMVYFGVAVALDDIEAQSASLGLNDAGTATVITPATAAADQTFIDAMVGIRAGDFEGRLFAGDRDRDGSDATIVVLEADYTIGDLLLQATYGDSEVGTTDVNLYGLAASYSMDKVGFNGGWSAFDTDISGVKTVNTYFVNVDYAIATKATVYAEVGFSDAKDAGDVSADTGFAVGMVLKF